MYELNSYHFVYVFGLHKNRTQEQALMTVFRKVSQMNFPIDLASYVMLSGLSFITDTRLTRPIISLTVTVPPWLLVASPTIIQCSWCTVRSILAVSLFSLVSYSSLVHTAQLGSFETGNPSHVRQPEATRGCRLLSQTDAIPDTPILVQST